MNPVEEPMFNSLELFVLNGYSDDASLRVGAQTYRLDDDTESKRSNKRQENKNTSSKTSGDRQVKPTLEEKDALTIAQSADLFQGGRRNDVYRVDHPGDRIRERKGGGIDTVRSVINWKLSRNLENLKLRGKDAVRGVGNSLDNTITGNGQDNILIGKNGDDRIKGKAGSDRLQGGKGADILMGASRASQSRKAIDMLQGGKGADTFVLGKRKTTFYDDRRSQTSGFKDYALIKGFNLSEDTLQIGGTWSDYVFENTPKSLPRGVALYRKNDGGGRHELIAIIRGTSVTELTAYYQSTSPKPPSTELPPTELPPTEPPSTELPPTEPPSQPQVSYSDAANSIIANLDTGEVLLPIFGIQETPSIMPMGDSITAGVHTEEPYPGAYRIQLWDRFFQDNLAVDFVGSQSNGLENGLPDQNHEGYPGERINFFINLVNNGASVEGVSDEGVFDTNPTDILLLMVGANNANADPDLGVTDVVNEMFRQLDSLLQRIDAKSPNTKVLLSSITPRDSGDTEKVQRVTAFNAQLPAFVQDQVTEDGRNVTFVNAGGSLGVDDLNPDGLHPDVEGYTKLGDAWYEALVKREQLSGISHLEGSNFDDRITGNGNANTLNGGAGEDWLSGTTAVLAGANERDILIGGAGNDRFILGDSSQAYYAANGDSDYVVVRDFNAGEDVIQLHGAASDYIDSQVGGDRYLYLSGVNELIAVFSNTSSSVLGSVEFA
jgi:Ca2+-binding RTX toxin-like protein